jgi:hypothetical protein
MKGKEETKQRRKGGILAEGFEKNCGTSRGGYQAGSIIQQLS